MKYLFLLCLSFIVGIIHESKAQQTIFLYEGAIPNSKDVANKETMRNGNPDATFLVSNPTLTVYIPENGNGAAVIVCPGGGYGGLVMNREGHDVAKEFNKRGIAAFVLKYRLPSDTYMIDKSIGPLQDAQRAFQLVRQNAQKWKVNPAKVGILGFSAGGHLAASAGVQFQNTLIANPSKINLRPDFLLLIYPVISLDTIYGHSGTRKNLLGENPSPNLVHRFSNEENVSNETPPAFLTHPTDDDVVPVENSLLFYEKLRASKVPVGMHIYAKGGHGYLKEPAFDEWFGRCILWLQTMAFIP